LSNNGETIKALWGMIIISLIAIVAMTQGLDGEIGRIAIYGVIALGLGIEAVNYYFSKRGEKDVS